MRLEMMGRHRACQGPVFDGRLQARAHRIHKRHAADLMASMRRPFLPWREPLPEVVQEHREARAGCEPEGHRLTQREQDMGARIPLRMVFKGLRYPKEPVDLRELHRQGPAGAQGLYEKPRIGLGERPVELGKDALRHEGRHLASYDHGAHERQGLGRHGKPETGGETRDPQNPHGILGERRTYVTQDAGAEIGKSLVGIDERAIQRTRHGVDGEIPPPQVLLQSHVGIGVDHETVVAGGGLALGPGERVLAVGLGVQEHWKIRADTAEAQGLHLLRGTADHDIIPINDRSSEELVADRAAYQISFHVPRPRIGLVSHCIGFLPVLLGACALSGCALPYYAQAVSGEAAIMRAERPIARVLADPAASPALKERLRYVLALRRFAHTRLGLALHGDYRAYADLHRPYVVWNVFAAHPFSLALKRWCFPFAGCVAYRGYFSQKAALRYASHLERKGYDVFVGGVPAFATLGYLRDPVLSTFIGYRRTTIAHIIFHELGHDLIYVPDATTFDESFADTVAAVGVRRYLRYRGTESERVAYRKRRARHDQVLALMRACRARLARIYADPTLSLAERAGAKRAAFQALRRGFLGLARSWGGNHGYGAFFRGPLNNALLGAYMSYETLVPAFRRLLALENGDLPAFFRAVRWYARIPAPLRDRELRSRRGLVERLPTLQQTQARDTLQRRRERIMGAQSPRLPRPIQHRPHDQT